MVLNRNIITAGIAVLVTTAQLHAADVETGPSVAGDIEVPVPTAAVSVREHPKTGKPFVVITTPERARMASARGKEKTVHRPDYQMLAGTPDARHIVYEGPSSNRTKVYVLAASLMAAGAATAAVAIAAPPAVTATSSAGAGTLAGAGVALTGAAVATPIILERGNNQPDEGIRRGEVEITENNRG